MAKVKQSDNAYIQTILSYCELSKQHKQKRSQKRLLNWDMFNLKQNYSHKAKGQSKEFIPKTALGIENLKATMIQALTNRSDEWFDVGKGMKADDIFTPDVVRKILGHHLYDADAYVVLANALVYVALDGLVAAKVGGCYEKQHRFNVIEPKQKDLGYTEAGIPIMPRKPKPPKIEKEEVTRWKATIDLIDFEDFYFDPDPNPTGPLFEVHAVRRDLFDLIDTAESTGVYDMDVIKQINDDFERQEEEQRKKRTRDHDDNYKRGVNRHKVTLREMWGTIIDPNTGKIKERNVVCTIANDRYMIRPPQKNPRPDQLTPFVYSTLVDVPGSMTSKAFMDAPSRLNKTLNESFNLLMDGFFDQIKGIKQLRAGFVVNPKDIAGGIRSGQTIKVSDDMPLGAQVVEKVRTGEVPADAFGFYKYIESITDESMLSSELRAAGLPPASTKATIASISEQNIQGLFGSLARIFEDRFIAPLLNKLWVEILNNMESDEFAEETLINLVGEDKAVKLIAMSKEERYARGAMASKFQVRGISSTFNRLREFNRLVSVLGQLGQSPDIYAEFKKEFSMKKFMGAIISAAGLREDDLRLSEEEKKQQRTQESINMMINQAMSGMAAGGNQPAANGKVSESESPIQPMEGNA